MKYIVLVPDGASDYPLEELNGKTPLQAAKKPNMDFLAQKGITGTVKTVPEGMEPGSDVANLSLFGYDPLKYYTGRGPLEAANRGIFLKSDETAFRCNLITASDELIFDYSAGHISTEEAKVLIEALDEKLANESIRFYSGISYRHLMIIKGDFSQTQCTPPHNVVGEPLVKHLPQGSGDQILKDLINASRDILKDHPINLKRIKEGKNPANLIWLWGQGKAPLLPTFKEKYDLEGGVISAVDLIKGIGHFVGLEVVEVPGATGYYDTDYTAKANYALDVLKEKDFVFVHVEAPDEAGHAGDIKEKIRAIENFDEKLVSVILRGLENYEAYRILLVPDHPTPIKVRTHVAEPVPFVIYDSLNEVSGAGSFDEISIKGESLCFKEGYKLMDFFIKKGEKTI